MAVKAGRCAAGVVVEDESERAGAENEARESQIRVFLLAPSPHTLDLLRALSNHPV